MLVETGSFEMPRSSACQLLQESTNRVKEMMKELKFEKIIENLIGDINEAKRKSESIHSAGNIKASGDEVENLIREKISLFLPERYLVKQGHIINSEGKVSNQFDIIIFDRLNTPKFFESENETVFFPIESVLAVGEIKKTLRKNDVVELGKKIKFLKNDMNRRLYENSTFGGISGKSLISDSVKMPTNQKYKNPLFSFLFAIDVEKIQDLEYDDENKYMPNDVYILNYGFFLSGTILNNRIVTTLEDENPNSNTVIKIEKAGVICLSMMLKQLINHLNKCHIEPYSISHYMTNVDIYGIKGEEMTVYNLNNKVE